MTEKLLRRPAYWTCDESEEVGPLYYFAIEGRTDGPFTTRRVEAILDIAPDGTLAGVELVEGLLPKPPR